MIGFFLVFNGLLGALHVYIWRRLVKDTGLQGTARRAATAAIVGLGLSLPASMWISRHAPNEQAFWPAALGYTWLGTMFYVFVFLLMFDVVRMVTRLKDKLAPTSTTPPADLQDPSRRQFLARAGAVTTLASSGVVSAYGLYSGLGDIEKPEIPVRLSRLPKALDGFRIAQLTDVHIGDLLGQRFLRHVVNETNGLRPDLIAITGDLVDGSVAELGPAVAELAKLKARHGVYFVTGNHEYYSGAPEWIAFLRSLGIRVLSNERLSIGDAHPGGASFDLIGVPDHHAKPVAPDMLLAARGRDEARELIVLAHQPVQVRGAIAINAGLQISGHTHGGQLFPFGALTALAQPHIAGLERAGGDTQIYTSRGTGFWGPPMRVLAPAEISSIVLTS